jgi:hypothetical protein
MRNMALVARQLGISIMSFFASTADECCKSHVPGDAAQSNRRARSSDILRELCYGELSRQKALASSVDVLKPNLHSIWFASSRFEVTFVSLVGSAGRKKWDCRNEDRAPHAAKPPSTFRCSVARAAITTPHSSIPCRLRQ